MKNTNSVTFAKALADPTRQQIMEIICCEWKNVNEIVEIVDVRQPTVSHHLSILKEAGLVNTRIDGKHTYYILNQSSVALCCGQIIDIFAPGSENDSNNESDHSDEVL
jgi:ArsR family transcriptional regulator